MSQNPHVGYGVRIFKISIVSLYTIKFVVYCLLWYNDQWSAILKNQKLKGHFVCL